MFIDRIIVNNFRVYKGENVITLSVPTGRNVSVISGNNGFGKTSLLTSLVWCLYGKLMVDVDDRYRKEIFESGGYKKYCNKLMNCLAIEEKFEKVEQLREQYLAASEAENQNIEDHFDQLNSFSVAIRFNKIFIPVIPCQDLEIVRKYNHVTQTETLAILIDGHQNELTKQVGQEIFINDFILRKDIAKFFFFDAEKIVELAEINSIEDRRNLSRAYGEVLGIKKYLDLKSNLENLRLRLRKKSSAGDAKERLEKLIKQFEQNGKMITHYQTMLGEKEEEVNLKKIASDKFQEQLIREGSSITLAEMKDFRQMKDHLQADSLKLKSQMKDIMEMAPLAIAARKIETIRSQLEQEQELRDKKHNTALLKRKASSLRNAISNSSLGINKNTKDKLFNLIDKTLIPQGVSSPKILLNLSPESENDFFAVYENLQNSFVKTFKNLTTELKKNQSSLGIINRKLTDAESKENDPVVRKIREDKTLLDAQIKEIEKAIIEQKAEILSIENSQRNIGLQISELNKKIKVSDLDQAKDEMSENLIKQLEIFILKLKIKKKESLERNILKELKVLMHKQNFVKLVEVIIDGDLIDIDLYDFQSRKIDKNSLSKGEQQLYATALLKALVEESHIKFPVFIDSPLQKFDKEHAKNIIKDFYPEVSAQVILFPLLQKELLEEEFTLLQPKISECYLIQQVSQYHSTFRGVKAENLFEQYNKTFVNVHVN